MTDVADVIRRLYALAGVEQDKDLAPALGVTPAAIANWRLRGAVSSKAVARAASHFGVSIDHVLNGDKEGYQGVADVTRAHYGAALDDPRLQALVDWLSTLWNECDEEQRAWLVVELRMLRGKLRSEQGQGSRKPIRRS